MGKCSKIWEKNEQRVRTAVHRRGKKTFTFTQNKGNTNGNYSYLEFSGQTGKSPHVSTACWGGYSGAGNPHQHNSWRAKPQTPNPNTLWASNSPHRCLTQVKNDICTSLTERAKIGIFTSSVRTGYVIKGTTGNNRAMKFCAAVRKGIKGSWRWRAW